MKKVTMMDVAKEAGVSKSTVSQYINNRFEYMSQETRERIEQSIKDLGYIPNFIAKSLKQKKTSTIGVIVANILHAFSTEIIRSIEDVAGEHHVHVFVCNADDNPEKEKEYIEMLLAKQVDGLIILPTGGNIELYCSLKKMKFPIVFMDRKIQPTLYPTLLLDNHSAAELAVTELIRAGNKRIGFISSTILPQVTPRMERLEGYRHTLMLNDLQVNEQWVVQGKAEAIREQLSELYESGSFPDAIFTANDLSLIELLKFTKQHAIQIPEDLRVVTIDDSPYLDAFTPSITVVKQPTFVMGKEAATLLLKLIKHPIFKEEYDAKRFTPELIKRESIQMERI
ncbi:LacI family DNA-binding transcriptional regulator [Chryseomicrobium palamuruense]|uniref:LacI family DNA-binding transcriptional regulator n=1 Tax=Chryseomicrobium palamuruense TaxID=682973 RepID=A0ABV8UUQ3_9BACL